MGASFGLLKPHLHFDAEASLKASVGENFYEVHITLPYVKEKRP